MATVYLYILGANPYPDRVVGVPWRVNDHEIFFGPCKKRIREELRPRLLDPQTDRATAREEIYLGGFNATPPSGHVRKLVWAGRISEAMSFGRAWLDLNAARYAEMRAHSHSPVHVLPVSGGGRATRYRLCSQEHALQQAWLKDLLTPAAKRNVVVSGGEVRLRDGVSWWYGFPRDVCFLLDNLFFATGRGLDVDEDLLQLLREAQPERRGIDAFAVFGLNTRGIADGRVGGHLQLTGALAASFLRWMKARTPHTALPPALPDLPPMAGAARTRRC